MQRFLPMLVVVAAVPLPAAAAVATLVLNVESRVVPRDQLETLSEELRAELAGFSALRVIGRGDIVRMLGVEEERQLAGCDTSSCMAEIAGALGAEQLVTGSIGRAGEGLLVQLQMIDSRRASVVRRVSHPVAGGQLIEAMRAAARKLMAVTGTLHLVSQVEGAEVFVAEKRIGVLPLKPFAVEESGNVLLRVEHVDYLPYDAAVDLTPGKTTRHILRLRRYDQVEADAVSRRRWGLALFGGAAAAAGVSAFGFTQANRAYDEYRSQDPRRTDEATLRRLEGRTSTNLLIGWIAAAATAVLAGSGAYLVLVNPHQELLDGSTGAP